MLNHRGIRGLDSALILFHAKRHPQEMGEPEVAAFLTDLAVRRNVSASTQNQALSALLFLYAEVLKTPLADLGVVERARRPKKVPVVLTGREAQRLLAQLEGVECLLYGSGPRLLEMLRLRVKDVVLIMATPAATERAARIE